MKISIIGTGYVGLVTGACLAELGNDVICADIDKKKIEMLEKGKIFIYETGLEEIIKRNIKEKRLYFTTDIKSAIKKSKVVFNAVGTPSAPDYNVDLSAVFAVAKEFGCHLNSYKIFVNKSTVPVGTSEKVKKIIQKESKNKQPFDVIDNPEFLREGTAVKDFMNPDRIVVGVDSANAKKIMERVYAPLVRAGRPLVFTDIKSAEIIKYASNAFLAAKISFMNELANFCEKSGGNIREVAKGVGLDSRIGPRFLHAGIGWGGSCFPKDVKGLIRTGQDFNFNFRIIKAVDEVNEEQKYILIKKLKNIYPKLKNKKIAVWGLSFKPKTDDLREASSLIIIKKLQEAGASIQSFDPIAIPNAQKIINPKNIIYSKTPYDALKGADALLIVTEWDEFRSIDFKKMKKIMKTPIILDGRNIYNSEEVKKAGFQYYGIGIN